MLRKRPNPIQVPLGMILLALLATKPSLSQSTIGKQGFCIHGQGLSLPIGQFLLIRKGTQLGALRLTSIVDEENAPRRAGEWIGAVGYESYFIDGDQTLSSKSAIKTVSTLHFGRIKGMGFHYSWQSGKKIARVGPWKFYFFDQDGMFMTTADRWHGVEYDSGLEFAPTGFTEITRVEPKDSRLHWYKRNPDTDIPCPVVAPH